MQNSSFDRIDRRITSWMARYGIRLLRISLGIVFFWFGVLKFFPTTSPAEAIATDTILMLSGGLVQPEVSLPLLAIWETLIGLGLIFGLFMRAIIALLMLQMLGTLTPLVLFIDRTWSVFPLVPTLEGQYIIKNLVLVSAALVIGATVRGGYMIAQPGGPEIEEKRPEQDPAS